MKNFNFGKYCTPAQLYLILAGISLLTAFFKNFRVVTLGVNLIFVVIWAWVLNWMCGKGLQAVSWILVLLPFILFAANFFMAMDASDMANGIKEGMEDKGEDDEDEEEEDEEEIGENEMEIGEDEMDLSALMNNNN